METPPRKFTIFFWRHYRAGILDWWFAEAFTQFLNGFISGIGIASVTGTSGGIATAASGAIQSPIVNALLAAGGTFLVLCSSGLTQFRDWHKSNPLPNPVRKPTGETVPPFQPQPPTS